MASARNPDPREIPCFVSEGMQPRAVALGRLILDALVEDGFTLGRFEESWIRGTRLIRGSWHEEVAIRETHRAPRKRTAKGGPDQEPEPILAFRVGNSYQKEHRDWKRANLEERVPELVAAVRAMYEQHVDFQRRVEKSRAAEAAARQAKLEEEARLAEVEERFQALAAEAERWDRSARIRAYADAVEQAVLEEYGPGLHEGAKNWLAWARGEADVTDPIVDLKRQFAERRAAQAEQGLELVPSENPESMARFEPPEDGPGAPAVEPE